MRSPDDDRYLVRPGRGLAALSAALGQKVSMALGYVCQSCAQELKLSLEAPPAG